MERISNDIQIQEIFETQPLLQYIWDSVDPELDDAFRLRMAEERKILQDSVGRKAAPQMKFRLKISDTPSVSLFIDLINSISVLPASWRTRSRFRSEHQKFHQGFFGDFMFIGAATESFSCFRELARVFSERLYPSYSHMLVLEDSFIKDGFHGRKVLEDIIFEALVAGDVLRYSIMIPNSPYRDFINTLDFDGSDNQEES